jgi:hypothetical protein
MGYVVARDGFGRGDLLPFLVWATGLGLVVAAMATALQTRHRGWSAPTRVITRSILGAATGYLWCVMMAWSMGPWFGTLSFPVLLVMTTSGAVAMVLGPAMQPRA